jgi:ABC-2 type transport system permease protein
VSTSSDGIPVTGAAPAGSGVIHDIGYRHYAGPRLGRGYILRSLYVDSLRGAYGFGRSARSKVVPIGLFALTCLPAAILVLVAALSRSKELPGGYGSYVINLSVVVAVFLAAQAPVAVSRDLRYRVMSLYLSRPLSRLDYVVAKVAAFSTAVFVLLAAPLTLLFLGALLVKLPLGAQLRAFLPALAGAVLFALVLSAIALAIAAATPRRGFGVAAIITILMVLISVSGIAQALARDSGSETASGYAGLVSPFSLVQGVQTWALGTDNPLPSGPPGTTGGLVFTAVTLAVLAACYGVLVLRYRKVSVS